MQTLVYFIFGAMALVNIVFFCIVIKVLREEFRDGK